MPRPTSLSEKQETLNLGREVRFLWGVPVDGSRRVMLSILIAAVIFVILWMAFAFYYAPDVGASQPMPSEEWLHGSYWSYQKFFIDVADLQHPPYASSPPFN
jgi:hypothetical protein